MYKFFMTTLSIVAFAAGMSATTLPAYALGACGANYHRDGWGHCVWGGQNQNWCLRHTGHMAGQAANGTRWCR